MGKHKKSKKKHSFVILDSRGEEIATLYYSKKEYTEIVEAACKMFFERAIRDRLDEPGQWLRPELPARIGPYLREDLMSIRYEIVRNSDTEGDQQHFWRIVASNGETLAHSEMYHSPDSCRAAVVAVLEGSRTAEIHEIGNETSGV